MTRREPAKNINECGYYWEKWEREKAVECAGGQTREV